MYISHFAYSFIQLSVLYLLAIVNHAAMNTGMHRSLRDPAFTSLGYRLRSGIAGSFMSF